MNGKFKHRFAPCLAANLLDAYALERNVRNGTMAHYSLVLFDFARWYDINLDELTDDHFESQAVNRYLQERAEKLSPWTLKQRRISLLVMWRFGNEAEMISRVPRRIRPIKTPPLIIQTWSVDDVRRLITEIEKTKGNFRKTWVPKSLYLSALIRTAWDTGLRKADMFALKWEKVKAANGRLLVIQQKTNHPVRIQISVSTMEVLAKLDAVTDYPFCFPPIMRGEHISRAFTRAVTAAGLTGNLTTLRKSSGTHIEQQAPGMGWIHLGHKSPETTRKWYIDGDRAYNERPRPDELN